LELEPEDLSVLVLKKGVLLQKGDMAQVVEVSGTIARLDPSSKAAFTDMAMALEKLGRLEEAVATYDQAISLDDRDRALHNKKGLALIALERYPEAVDAFDFAYQINTEDPRPLDNKGRALLLMHYFDEALEVFERCVSMSPETAQYHSDRGRALAASERYREAVESFDKALALDRRDGATWKYKGSALFKIGQYENAIGCYNHAIDHGVEDPQLYRLRGRAMEELGRDPDALDSYQKALTFDENDVVIWARLAAVYAKLGDYENGIGAVERALKLDPGNKKAWIERASMMEKLGRDEEALRSYDSAIGLEPNDPFAWSGKGRVLLGLGSHDLAKDAFDRALALDPSLGSAAEGARIAQDRLHQEEVTQYALKVLETEYRNDKDVTKEDAFTQCGVPYSHLDEVFTFLSEKQPINIQTLSASEFDDYEEASRKVLLAAYRNPSVSSRGLRLSDVLMNMQDRDVLQARKVLAYIEHVNQADLRGTAPDPKTEKLLRGVLGLPEEDRSMLGIMESLEVGPFTARKLLTMAQSLRGPSAKSAGKRKASESAMVEEAEEGPLQDLVERATTRHAKVEAPMPVKHRSPYEAPEMISKSYREERKPDRAEAPQEEGKGRRCLFHGNLAVMKCPSCASVLCKQCAASGTCPRCKAPLGASDDEGEAQPQPKAAERMEEKPSEPEASRDWSRL